MASVAAQSENLVIHLYVDPIYGHDWSASVSSVNGFFNPDGVVGLECSSSPTTGPHSVLEFRNSQGAWFGNPLLHAPHPFKTITGAIAYINRLAPSGGGAPLPHTDPNTNKTWAFCIIHLLPGWYGRTQGSVASFSHDGRTGTHRDSRIVPNGETFPIHLPPRVSLVGTSALNTVIDTGQVGTAIEFGKVVNGTALSGWGTFIDKITFYACGGKQANGANQPDPRQCAAILVDDQVDSLPTISNCVFVKNVFGVIVNAQELTFSPGIPFAGVIHNGTTIINCTFAWNMFGLWNGQIDRGNDSVGVSVLNIVNNIFDGSETIDNSQTLACDFGKRSLGPPASDALASWPNWATVSVAQFYQVSGGGTSFEGVAQQDMRVLVSGVPTDFNAYEFRGTTAGFPLLFPTRNYNLGLGGFGSTSVIAGLTPITTPRPSLSGTPHQPEPARNLADITGFPYQAPPNNTVAQRSRGVLFVSDLLCRGAAPGVQATSGMPNHAGFDRSPLDLRLSPNEMAAVAPSSTNTPAALNRLIDAGFGGPFPAIMENGQALLRPGSMLSSYSPTYQHDFFECDAEGYGNPRVHNHPMTAGTFVTEPIDVGADEVGELIVAGYRMGSTTFLRLNDTPSPGHPFGHQDLGWVALNQVPPGHPTIANDHLLYIGAIRTLQASVPQPEYRRLGYYSSTSLLFPVNAYPAAYGNNVTWHSAETRADYTQWGSTMFSEPRPYFALRTQDPLAFSNTAIPLSDRKQPAEDAPDTLVGATLFDALHQMGKAYLATAADVTPCLRPDIHPWWAEFGPSFGSQQLIGGHDLYATPTAFPIWQDQGTCPGSNYLFNSSGIGTRNTFLYAPPSAQDIAPSGAGGPLTASGVTYAWLDNIAWVVPDVPTPARFDNWSTAPLTIANFNSWCLGGTGGAGVRGVTLPRTTVTIPPNSVQEAAALRFSVEWGSDIVLWQVGDVRQSNLQSFLVVIDG